ncbi:ATP-dependent RNA helicase RhlB, partial [Luteimonas deserti]
GPRKPRSPAGKPVVEAAAPAAPVVETPAPVIDAAGAVAAAMPDESRPPRKRRRRRGGKKIEGAEAASTQGNGAGQAKAPAVSSGGPPRSGAAQGPREVRPTARPAPAAPAGQEAAPSLFSRIGRGLRRLVSGGDAR